jgi:hypothetical protein
MTSPAGGAGAANGGGDAAQNGQAAQGEAQQAQGPDVGALAEQLNGLSQSQEQMRDFLMSNPWAQQQGEPEGEGAGEEPGPLDLSFLDDAGYDQQAATQLAEVFERQMAQQLAAQKSEFEQRLNSVTERVSEREQMEMMRDLVDEFPDMAKTEVARPIVEQTHTMVEAYGWPKEVAADPRMWRLTYLAQSAMRNAQEEGSEQPEAAHLEGGAGAAGVQRQQGDDFTQILDAAAEGGRKVLPFG